MQVLQDERCRHDLALPTCALCTPRVPIDLDPLSGMQSMIADHEFTCPGCDALIPVGRRVYLVDGVWLGSTCAERAA